MFKGNRTFIAWTRFLCYRIDRRTYTKMRLHPEFRPDEVGKLTALSKILLFELAGKSEGRGKKKNKH